MSLITRCPVCETMFKVVADQFKVAQGWVRCGYCGEVFDAALHLVPAEVAAQYLRSHQEAQAGVDQSPRSADTSASPTAAAPPPPSTPQPQDHASHAPAVAEPKNPDADTGVPDGESAPEPLAPAPAVAEEAPESALPSSPPDEGPSQAFEGALPDKPTPPPEPSVHDAPVAAESTAVAVAPELPQPAPPPAPDLPGPATPAPALSASAVPLPGPSEPREPAVAAAASALHVRVFGLPQDEAPETLPFKDTSAQETPEIAAPTPAPAAPEVSFVRDARRKAFWATPLVRGLLALLALLLLAALLLQWVLQHKDDLAARDARLAPFLRTLCVPLNCTVRPPRRIESVVIDSSSFSKAGPDLYRLSFVLKNNSAAALEMPALEVTLIDSQEQALVRRVLKPADFGAAAAALAGHAELAGTVTLRVSGQRAPGAPAAAPWPVTGYRILAFYP